MFDIKIFYFLSFLPQSSKSAAILEAYVKLLIEDERCGHLVAVYTASLPPEAQLSCYASFLETITDSDLRRKYVSLAEEAGNFVLGFYNQKGFVV